MANNYTIKVGERVACKDTHESALLQAEFARNGIESEQLSINGVMYVEVTAIYGKNNHSCKQEGI